MTWRNQNQWSKYFVEWIDSDGGYAKAFHQDKLKPTYSKDFFQWSLAEESFNAGARAYRDSKTGYLTEEQKKEVLAKYLQWVDDVSEALPDKSVFSVEEIVMKVVSIVEEELGLCK